MTKMLGCLDNSHCYEHFTKRNVKFAFILRDHDSSNQDGCKWRKSVISLLVEQYSIPLAQKICFFRTTHTLFVHTFTGPKILSQPCNACTLALILSSEDSLGLISRDTLELLRRGLGPPEGDDLHNLERKLL